jgi:type IV secretion system protein VirB11
MDRPVNNYIVGVDRGLSVLHFMQPLKPWLEDGGITEICINRPHEVFVERAGKWETHEVPAFDFAFLESFGVAVAAFTNNNFDETRPILSAVLPDGERVQFVRPPACEADTISVTIRKPSFQLRTLESYAEQGFFEHVKPIVTQHDDLPALNDTERELIAHINAGDYVTFFRRAVQTAKVVVVAGETGSGKTTFMKAMMQEIPASQRLITIEDVPELFLPNHPNHIHLFYPSEAKEEENAPVTSASLLKSCLRMKPDRILLAELRGGETFDFINVCSSGHAGSITSCHAGSAELTFERLALMILQNRQGRTLPYDVIRKLLYLVVDVVLHVHNDVGGLGRHVTECWFDPMKKRSKQ